MFLSLFFKPKINKKRSGERKGKSYPRHLYVTSVLLFLPAEKAMGACATHSCGSIPHARTGPPCERARLHLLTHMHRHTQTPCCSSTCLHTHTHTPCCGSTCLHTCTHTHTMLRLHLLTHTHGQGQAHAARELSSIYLHTHTHTMGPASCWFCQTQLWWGRVRLT